MTTKDTIEETATTSGINFMPNITNDTLASLTVRQRSFLIGIRAIESDIWDQALRELIADECPLGILFHDEIGKLGGVWTKLRRWLACRGVILKQHSSRRVIMTLAQGIYENAEDRASALHLAQQYLTSHKKTTFSGEGFSRPSTGTSDTHTLSSFAAATPGRVAHNVAMRFKDAE